MQAYITSCIPYSCNSCTNSDEIRLCDAPESNRSEIGPIELATECSGKSKKGVTVCPVTLDKVALDLVLHMVSYCVAVSAHTALCVVGCYMRVPAAHAALCMVGYYMTVLVYTISHATLVMLSQFGYCKLDVAAVTIAAPPKFPQAMSGGLVDLFLLFSFPKKKLKRYSVLFGFA